MLLRHCTAAAAALLWSVATAGAQDRSRFLNPPELSAPRGYSHVAEVRPGSRLLYVSGQVPLDSAGRLVGPGDFRAQAHQVFRNLGAALRAGRARFSDVVKLNFYLVDASQLQVLREVRNQYVDTTAPPASTLVEVRRLFRDDVLLEIEAVAAVP
jgi:enamine deaminase RidA (YjgF/YER057c/UK114 family)